MKKVGRNVRLKPVDRSGLANKVAEAISQGLLDGSFRPGTRLVENDLAEMLDVSRSPIREAISELANSGLVTRQPGRGALIREWTVEDLNELSTLRALLEGFAAQLVRELPDKSELASLDEIIDRMGPTATADDYASMIELDLAFHHRLWELAGNRLLERVLQGLSLQFRLFLTLNWKFHGGLDRVEDNHRGLLKTLREGSSAELAEAVTKHVRVENMLKGYTAQAAFTKETDEASA